tara:strand:+ start:18073 stop:19032 length:960 start_codon:yes stop_codon:yes gene_type:complete
MNSIGFGTWSWGNKILWGYQAHKDDEELEKTFNIAIKNGINLIDTADSYGIGQLNGQSEKLLGEFLAKIPPSRRKRITVATKLAPFPWRLGRNGFRDAFKSSKERLQGKLDRVQLHWSTYRYAPWQELQLLDGLSDLLDEGLVPEIGISNMGPKRLKWVHNYLQKRGIPITSLQIQFSLISPQPKKTFELIELCKDLNIQFLAYSPLALGILSIPPGTNKYKGTYLRRSIYKRLIPCTEKLRKELNNISNRRKVSQSQVALNWCRYHGAIPIPGIRKSYQAKDIAYTSKWKLTKIEANSLDIFSKNCLKRMPNNPFQSN